MNLFKKKNLPHNNDKLKKEKKKIFWRAMKILLLFQVVVSVFTLIYESFWKIEIIKQTDYAWTLSKELAPQVRLDYTISATTYELPDKYKWGNDKDSKISRWLLNKTYQRALERLPANDPLLILFKFRKDTFEYDINEQNVADYFKVYIDAIEAIKQSSLPYKDYHVAKGITLQAILTGKLNMLKRVAPDIYEKITELICQNQPITLVKDIGTNEDLLAKYIIQTESDAFPRFNCLVFNIDKFNINLGCNSPEMNEIVTGYNQFAKWRKKSLCNFKGKFKKDDDVKILVKEFLKRFIILPKGIRKSIIEICPNRAEELTYSGTSKKHNKR